MSQIVPLSPIPLTIRTATLADIPFIDALMKTQRRALGYWPLKQIEGHVVPGYVLIAEEMRNGECGMRNEFSIPHSSFSTSPLGYLISRDRYLKRDELGVIYQMNVVPGAQRKLVGASLLREAFRLSAYGCRLYSCWCAQDLVVANTFWEAMGFVPIAFRAGSDRKKRVHIFWQKRIVEGDVETKSWYPCKTESGAIRADRVVFPIPADVNWRDVRAVEVPVVECGMLNDECGMKSREMKRLPDPTPEVQAPKPKGPLPGQVAILVGGRMKYIDRPGYIPPPAVAPSVPLQEATKITKPKRAKKRRAKVDPAFLKNVRELRDRYLEHINSDDVMLISHAKYEVLKLTDEAIEPKRMRALPAA